MSLQGDVAQHTVTYYADQAHNVLGAHREKGAQSYRTLNGAHDKMWAKVWHVITFVQLMGGSGKLQRRTQITQPSSNKGAPTKARWHGKQRARNKFAKRRVSDCSNDCADEAAAAPRL